MATSNVLRFVTVRGPRKPTEADLETGFVRYDPALAAPLIGRVAQAESPEHQRRLIFDYIATSDYVASSAALSDLAGGHVVLGEWLAVEGDRITAAQLEERLAAPPTAPPAVRARLWDNLLAYTYGGGQPEVREGILGALRAINLRMVRPELWRSELAVRRLAQATVILPRAVSVHLGRPQPAKDLAEEPTPDPGADDRARVRAAWDEISRLSATYDELARHHRDDLERLRAAATRPPPVPRAGKELDVAYPEDGAGTPSVRVGLLKELFEVLPDDTRAVLTKVGVTADMRVAYALERLIQAGRQVANVIARDPRAGRQVVHVGGAFWMPEAATASPPLAAKAARSRRGGRADLEYAGIYTHGHFPPDPHDDRDEQCHIKPLGIADYRVVEQRLWCYQPGEVAHIENVLAGESKERVTRRLMRNETIATTETQDETTSESDTQTTDRFQIEREVEKSTEEDIKFDLGVNVQASYGVVRLTSDVKFAYAHSAKESDKAAKQYGKEVVDRAVERVVKKVRAERTVRALQEFEETNTHTLKANSEHVVGLYRWVNKIYRYQIRNYGRRLMFEFLVPEPGAFHLFASANEPVSAGVAIEKPVDPRSDEAVTAYNVTTPLRSATDLTAANYALWAAIYNASVDPPPAAELTISKAYSREGMDQSVEFAMSSNDLKLPAGYEASHFWASFGMHSQVQGGGPNWVTVTVGRHASFSYAGGSFEHALDGEDDFVPLSVVGRSKFFALNVEVRCAPSVNLTREWQQKTYLAVVRAYEERFAAYQTALAAAEAEAGVEIRGTNPQRNREIEMTELKKGCVRLMTRCADVWSDAMRDADPTDPCGVPDFKCCEALRDGAFVQFVEQAFEWKLLTYVFYPYFWGRKCKWRQLYTLEDADPIFLNFLQSGYARVVVPVRPGYERAALRFMADGTIWNGGTAPAVDSDLYVSIENELKTEVGEIDASIEPWFATVPTDLTVLQCETGCVEGTGLPCPHEGEDDGEDDHG